ncbi:WD repeat-containing protein 44 isoform X4 [Culicoides brevitarsis]|uniref:WD repeat-containing protein 44 isoform X4 n=1 Tax=Culicoides brevitarsis TaxID=469753 RepID=UPI00307C5BF2
MASDASDSSEEFYDAEDSTPNSSKVSKKRSPKTKDEPFTFIAAPPVLPQQQIPSETKIPETKPDALDNVSSSSSTSVTTTGTVKETTDNKIPKTSRQRFKELRHCLQNDDEENVGNTLTPDSQNSSVEGVFAPPKSSHPFRIIENDAMSIQSMTSLGRVGRILSGSVDPSSLSVGRDSNQLSLSSSTSQIPAFGACSSTTPTTTSTSTTASGTPASSSSTSSSSKTDTSRSSTDSTQTSREEIRSKTATPKSEIDEYPSNMPLQEPDVIASTKLAHSKTTDSIITNRPIPPPRQKRRGTTANKDQLASSINKPLSSSTENVSTLPKVHPKVVRSDSATQLKLVMPPPTQNTESLPETTPQTTTTSTKTETDNAAQAIPCSPGTIDAIQRELENSFAKAATSTPNPGSFAAFKQGSIARISHSLGNSTNSVAIGQQQPKEMPRYPTKPSPSNSAKSNSAPARVSAIDPSEGLDIFKATYGKYVVKPQDGEFNKAEGPSQSEMERIRADLCDIDPAKRAQFASTGSNSLGNGPRYTSDASKGGKPLTDRRKSAGDEELLKQLNVYVRTRTDSGKPLSDIEILSQVPVKNLDTGENFPLSAVEDNMPQYINPLSLHIMRLTSHIRESDDESVVAPGSEAPVEEEEGENEEESTAIKRKTAKIKRFFRSTVDKAKSIASEVSHARHKEDVAETVDLVNPEQNIKIKASSTNKGPYEFTKIQHVQDLSGEHQGAVWCMKFSPCGRLLATAGQDRVLRIWVLKDAYPFFQDMRTKYSTETRSSPTPSQESLVSHHSADEAIAMQAAAEKCTGPFMPKSFCNYTGHTSDLLDVSWSKNYFVLSSSMDKTVRLWHISRRECLCCFQHIDFVTAIAFHPRDDRYFLSGSLDGKLRLWNIPDKKVALWNEVDGQSKLITAANFCQNGKFAVVGSYDGRCLFYNTDQLKYHTQIHVRSTRGKNATGKKISGIEPMPGEDKILVTSNDSRIRLYDLRDLNLSCKYKGYVNVSQQIKASFSHDGKFIVAGSENQNIYIWKTNHDYAKLSSTRRDRSDFWEGIKAHNATVTCAIFAPHPELIIKPEVEDELPPDCPPDPLVEQRRKGCGGHVLVSADFTGCIKVFVNRMKPKHSSLPFTALQE